MICMNLALLEVKLQFSNRCTSVVNAIYIFVLLNLFVSISRYHLRPTSCKTCRLEIKLWKWHQLSYCLNRRFIVWQTMKQICRNQSSMLLLGQPGHNFSEVGCHLHVLPILCCLSSLSGLHV